MNKIFLAAILLMIVGVSCTKSGTSDNLNWEDKLETALQKAKSENKAVLVNFTGSDWCVWCQKLSAEVFSQPEFEDYANENLILVKIDFPEKIEQSVETKMYNNQLAQRFGIEGYPTIFLLKNDGSVALKTGYLPGGPVNYVSQLKSYL